MPRINPDERREYGRNYMKKYRIDNSEKVKQQNKELKEGK